MRVVFHPEAKQEAQRATIHYTEIHTQLGIDFRQELEEAVSRIIQVPTAWHSIKKSYRRCSLKRFPFGIIYHVDEQKNECQIYAVMHFKRKPGYWKSRKF
ncbi:MAG: type II toxin-antitoxin system RelE/ParE family toxin [Balneolaceae bacterium]|nr:type II toxin-antitoxin system RelE/ParE family toxin [Balneolaceae bacterium]